MRILVFQHVASEHPGSFGEVMARRGCTMRQVELDQGEAIPPLDDFDVLLVMGGPMDVWEEERFPWLRAEKAAIRAWVKAGRPYLGMCLGHQLLADALGGRVALMTAPPEVGMDRVRLLLPDPLFKGISDSCACFHWHAAEVVALPPGARLLASGDGCGIQAFGIGRNAYGLQFHLELTESMAAEWSALPEYAAALRRVKGPGAMPALQAEVKAGIAELNAAAYRVFGNFLDIAEAMAARQGTSPGEGG